MLDYHKKTNEMERKIGMHNKTLFKYLFKNSFKKLLSYSFIAITALGLSCLHISPCRAVTSALAASGQNISEKEADIIDISVYKDSASTHSNITADMTDASYDSTADIASGEQLIIESDEAIYGLYIIWSSEVSGYTISYNDKDNNKTSIQCGSYGYLHDYIPFNTAATSITIETSADMSISDIYAYSEGRLPETVQIWQPPCNDDTDILVFSTHADDEILFLGGVLTNYGGEQGLNVQVAYMCDFFLTEPVRQHEELDGLWECGIKNYPVKGDFMDLYSLDLGTAMTQYNYDDILSYATACVRRFKPLVCVSQDFNGEYGHGGHCIYAKAVSEAVNSSAEASFNPDSASEYGIWDTPKTYYHLYNENTITLDVDTPLSRFNQRTSVDILKTAFTKHVSQISYSFNVMDNGYAKTYWGNFDSRAFGLYRTTVGYDTGNDMMEHVTALHTEREAKKEAARLQAAKEKEDATDNTGSDNSNNEANDTSSNEAHSSPDIKQTAITLIAILIIGVVICSQAYRTRYLYKKKYEENKENFNKSDK